MLIFLSPFQHQFQNAQNNIYNAVNPSTDVHCIIYIPLRVNSNGKMILDQDYRIFHGLKNSKTIKGIHRELCSS
jgi:hypothetical protein